MREDSGSIRFTLEETNAIVSDLYNQRFNQSRDSRSNEYKNGFRAGAFNILVTIDCAHLYLKPTYPKGSCQLEAWYAGCTEGGMAARLFQINYLEGKQKKASMLSSESQFCPKTGDFAFAID